MFGIIHHLDVILHTVLAEVTGCRTVDAVAQGSGRSAQVQAIESEFLAVKVHMILGLIVASADIDVGRTGNLLEQAFQALGHTVGLGEVVTIDFIVDRVLATHAAASATTHIDKGLLDLRVVLEVFTHHGGNLGDTTLTLVGLVEHDVHRDDVATVALHRRKGVIAAGLTHGVVEGLDLGIFRGPLLVEALADVFGQVNTRADGQLQRDTQTTVIVGREELGADKLHQEHRGDKDTQCCGSGDPAVGHTLVKHLGIEVVNLVEHLKDGAIYLLENFGVTHIEAQQAATQHGRQHQGADQ